MEPREGLYGPYKFYVNTAEPVTLWFDGGPGKHEYIREYPDGRIEVQRGVTTVIRIIDKSLYLMPWAVKKTVEKARNLLCSELSLFDTELTVSVKDLDTILASSKTASKDIVDDAGDVGTTAHLCLEDSIKYAIHTNSGVVKQLINLPKDERSIKSAQSAFNWMVQHNVRWVETERKIYSIKYKYAGTMDGLCIVDACSDESCCPNEFKDVLSIADWKTSNYLQTQYLLQAAAYKYAYQEETGVHVPDIFILRLGKDEVKFDPWHMTEDDFELDFAGFITCLQLTQIIEEAERRMSEEKKKRTARRRAKKAAEKAILDAGKKRRPRGHNRTDDNKS